MRKVKVLAFVLAALMVVAAFAGCGTKQLKTDVSTLDERVTALEELLKQVNSTVNNAATADQINELLEAITANKAEAAAGDKALADAIAKITADQTAANDKLKADLEKLVNDVKADQKTGDAALQVAIEKLNNSLAATNKALEDSIEDLLEKIEDGDEDLSDAIVETNKALADAIAAINKAQDAQGKDVADALAASNKALEDAIKALQESTKASDDAIREDLLDAIEAITAAQNKQGEDLAAALKETNDALAAAIESLKGEIKTGDDAVRAELIAAIEALTKKQEEQNNAIADALAKLEETIAKNQEQAGANADLQSAINLYVGNLTVSKNDYTADSISYTAEENLAIAALHSNGIAAVQAATKVEDAKKAYDDALAGLAKYTAKDDALYNAVVALKGNLAKGTKDAVAKLVKLNTDTKKHYTDQGVDLKILTKYVGADGKTIDLDAEVANINKYQTQVNNFVASKDKSYSIAKLVDDISKVKYVLIATYVSGDTTKNANVSLIADYNRRYETFADAISGKQESATYISDSVLDLVTNYETLVTYVEKANGLAAAKAALGSYGELTTGGTYNGVFYEYARYSSAGILNEDATTANWWNNAKVYETISGRVSAWLEDYPVVDNENAHAIINAAYAAQSAAADDRYTFYADYLEKEEEANLFLAKYDEYVVNILPQVTLVEEFEEVTTANVQKFADVDELIADWRIVKEDGEDKDENPDLVIDDAQFDEMLKEIYGDKLETRSSENPFYFVEDDVRAWFNTTVADAKAVANDINEQIKNLIAAEDKALSVFDYKKLEGYVPVDDGDPTDESENYKMSSATVVKADVVANGKVVAGVSPTIYQFRELFVEEGKYDLTYLLDYDKFTASLAVVEAKVASYKAITDKIHSILDEIKSDLTVDKVFKGWTAVSLQNEADVTTLKTSYTELIAKGYKHEDTKSWTPAYDKNNKAIKDTFTYKPLMVEDDYYTITGLIKRVEDLRTMATNLVTFFGKISSVNSKKALTVAGCDTELAVWKKETRKVSDKNTDFYWYIQKAYKLEDRVFTPGYAQDSKTAPTAGNAMTQQEAVEVAWKAYAKFVADNQGYKDDAVEAALAANDLKGLKFIAIKAKAYNQVADIVSIEDDVAGNTKPVATEWKTVYGDFYTQQGIQLEGIKVSDSLDNVADILYGFRQMTGVSYVEITFAGNLIFHENGHRHLTGTNVVCPDCP